MRLNNKIKYLLITFLLIFVLASIGGGATFLYLTKDLPTLKKIADYQPWLSSKVYATDGRILAEFFEHRRDLTPSSQFPDNLVNAFVAVEDAGFFEHSGLNYKGILRAFIKNLQAGKVKEGGSSITQQVAKTLLLNPERKYERKFKEAVLATRIEKYFSKNDIMYVYLNQIYLGHGFYGVGTAARGYFSKDVKDLELHECAMLAALPKAPANYSPIRHYDKARERRNYVLSRMSEVGFISKEEAERACRRGIALNPDDMGVQAPYFCEYIRQMMEEKYSWEELYHGGLKIYTTLDLEMQKAAEQAVDKGLRELDHRQGYRGPKKEVLPEKQEEYIAEMKAEELIPGEVYEALVTNVDDNKKMTKIKAAGVDGVIELKEMKWARKPDPDKAFYYIHKPSVALKPGYVILVEYISSSEDGKTNYFSLYQKPEVQAALVCLHNSSGGIKAMIGGRDFSESEFNRAVQARRQVGSSIKPFIYAAALDKDYTPASLILDTAVVYENVNPEEDGKYSDWKPKNYGRNFQGEMPLREGLVKSINLMTIKILGEIGIDYAINYLRRFNIQTQIDRNLSLALGACSIPLLEFTSAYSVFPMGGKQAKPYAVEKVVDRFGRILQENEQEVKEVISPQTAYLITNIMQDVVNRGTGYRVRALNRPAGGKTGTTNDQKDAWFMGFTPEYSTGVWVGFDDNRLPLGKYETGSRAASPIWLYFMQEALKDKPVNTFKQPEGVIFVKIDRKSGLLAEPDNPEAWPEVFKAGTEPTEFCDQKPKYNPDELYRFDLNSRK